MRPASWPRVALLASVAAALVAGAGGLLEPVWFGTSRNASFDRVERHVRERFDELALTLQRTAVSVATDPGVPDGLTGDRAALVRLFDLIREAVPSSAGELAVTVYDAMATPRAWTGRPSELARDHVLAQSAFLVASGPLGLRLVYVEPIVGAGSGSARRRRIGVGLDRTRAFRGRRPGHGRRSVAAGVTGGAARPAGRIQRSGRRAGAPPLHPDGSRWRAAARRFHR